MVVQTNHLTAKITVVNTMRLDHYVVGKDVDLIELVNISVIHIRYKKIALTN